MKTELTSETLLANRTWMRRLAAALVRDAGLADDLEQQAWETALRQPPSSPGGLRAWLRKVLSNRLRNEVRSESRRRTRESVAEWRDPAATPEEMAARLELQRRTCVLVAGLDEPYQRVVYLRFFEDRDTRDIARLLDIAEGTVRWRLKTALDELRARLDQETGGDRSRWRGLLTPLAALDEDLVPSPPKKKTMPWFTWAVATVATLVVGAAVFILGGGRSTPPDLAPARKAGSLQAQEGLPVSSPPRLRAALPNPPDLGHCPEARELRNEVDLRARELEAFERPDELFTRSAPNPVAEQKFGAVLKPLLGTPPRCPFTFACRGVVCRVQVLLDEHSPHLGYRSCLVPPTEPHASADQILRDFLASKRSGMFGNATPVHDPISGKSFRRVDAHYRLATATADRVPMSQRGPEPELSPRRYRAWPPVPVGRSAACKREVARLHGELAAILARGDQVLRAEEAFAVNEPSPQNTAQLLTILAEVTGLSGDPFPLLVECRGTSCTVEPREPDDPDMAVKRVCEERDGREICSFDREHHGWFARLYRAASRHELIAQVDQPRPDRPAYVRLRSALESSRLDPAAAICAFSDRVRKADVFGSCSRRAADKGMLVLKVYVPGPDEPSRHITIDAAGDLAGTPLGRCVVEGMRAVALEVELPATRHGLVVHRRPTLPGARDMWAGRSICDSR